VSHRNFYQNGGWKSNASAIYHVNLMIIFNLMSLVVVGRNVRYFRTSAFLINHTTSLKTLHIFVKKYSVETSQTAAVYEARLAYGKMAAIHQLQNGASATASTINYIFFII
jgi:hypothetical protein